MMLVPVHHRLANHTFVCLTLALHARIFASVPIGDLPKYHFVLDEDTLDTHTEATDPDVREEGNAETWTPLVLVHVYIFLL